MLLSNYMQTVFEQVAVYFGISPDIIGVAVFMAASLLVGLSVLGITQSFIITHLMMLGTLLIGAFLGYVPLWIVFISAVTTGWWVFYNGGYEKVQNDFMWSKYGSRMKRAYKAKFGYENKEYSKEIDAHILVMKTQGEGFTKEQSEDWLKRHAQFVEIPFKSLEDEGSNEPSA